MSRCKSPERHRQKVSPPRAIKHPVRSRWALRKIHREIEDAHKKMQLHLWTGHDPPQRLYINTRHAFCSILYTGVGRAYVYRHGAQPSAKQQEYRLRTGDSLTMVGISRSQRLVVILTNDGTEIALSRGKTTFDTTMEPLDFETCLDDGLVPRGGKGRRGRVLVPRRSNGGNAPRLSAAPPVTTSPTSAATSTRATASAPCAPPSSRTLTSRAAAPEPRAPATTTSSSASSFAAAAARSEQRTATTSTRATASTPCAPPSSRTTTSRAATSEPRAPATTSSSASSFAAAAARSEQRAATTSTCATASPPCAPPSMVDSSTQTRRIVVKPRRRGPVPPLKSGVPGPALLLSSNVPPSAIPENFAFTGRQTPAPTGPPATKSSKRQRSSSRSSPSGRIYRFIQSATCADYELALLFGQVPTPAQGTASLAETDEDYIKKSSKGSSVSTTTSTPGPSPAQGTASLAETDEENTYIKNSSKGSSISTTTPTSGPFDTSNMEYSSSTSSSRAP